jgi:hypothetical protein
MMVYVCLLFVLFSFVQVGSFKTTGRGEADPVLVVGGVHGQTFTFIYNFDVRSTHVRRLLGDTGRFRLRQPLQPAEIGLFCLFCVFLLFLVTVCFCIVQILLKYLLAYS